MSYFERTLPRTFKMGCPSQPEKITKKNLEFYLKNLYYSLYRYNLMKKNNQRNNHLTANIIVFIFFQIIAVFPLFKLQCSINHKLHCK